MAVSPGFTIATPSANYASGTGLVRCNNHVLSGTASNGCTVGIAGITIGETGIYHIAVWLLPTTVAAASAPAGPVVYKNNAVVDELTGNTHSSSRRMGCWFSGQTHGTPYSDGYSLVAGDVVALGHRFGASRTITAGVANSGICVMRTG